MYLVRHTPPAVAGTPTPYPEKQMTWMLPTTLPSSPSSADTEVWRWASRPQSEEVELWVTLSGKPTPRPSSWRAWKSRPWSRLLFGAAMSRSWTPPHFSEWTGCAEVSPVSPGQRPGSRRGPGTSVGSGMTSSGSSQRSPLGTFSSKMFRASSGEDLDPSSVVFPRSGSMRSGECSELPMWEPPTDENGSSYWPVTPMASDAEGGLMEIRPEADVKLKMRDYAPAWPTPTASQDGKTPERYMVEKRKRVGPNRNAITDLGVLSKVWPTPAARDEKGTNSAEHFGKTGERHMTQLPNFVAHSSLPVLTLSMCGPGSCPVTHSCDQASQRDLRLNADFVEWVMGLPSGWSTARIGSVRSATEWSLYRRLLQSESWRLAQGGTSVPNHQLAGFGDQLNLFQGA